jgi:hypothetical protein
MLLYTANRKETAMSVSAAFDHPWFAEMILRFQSDTWDAKSVNPALDGLGTAVLAGSCIIAQALYELAGAVREGGGQETRAAEGARNKGD